MNKLLTLLIVLTTGLLMAQQLSNQSVFTGLVLEIGNNRINFEEAWIELTAPRAKTMGSIMITDEADQPINYADLQAPFLAEITFRDVRGQLIPVKIKILEQYQYDDHGFVK